jgi:hypothetical protein
MNFGTLNRLNEIEERIAKLEGAVQVLQERAALADALRTIAEDVESLKDWRDTQTKPRRTLSFGHQKDRAPA